MKRSILTVVVLLSLILCSFSVYAADGDLIVNGKVGIGTTTLQEKLHVNGNITLGDATVSNILSIHLGTVEGAHGSAIGIGASDGVNGNNGGFLLMAGKDFIGYSGCAVLGAGVPIDPDNTAEQGYLLLNTNNLTRIAILSNGNVGIGHTAPAATLDVKGTVKAFGDWTTKAVTTVYQAESDGFVVVVATISSAGAYVNGYTDGNSAPTTIRGYVINPGGSFTMPVRKGDYWKITTSGTIGSLSISWLPLGHQ